MCQCSCHRDHERIKAALVIVLKTLDQGQGQREEARKIATEALRNSGKK